ncbi:hypothetical protein ALC57_06743 [Trachymyrmex cornetzi]|uniref:Uncharacterized protein n=1 Tax=Trachymyrmex cornetzi TaxID=471704 RepID=A0A195E7K9_9HYME|nr:hypothetical protein ALC57_06743 [Trachymyrmex cornetzi]
MFRNGSMIQSRCQNRKRMAGVDGVSSLVAIAAVALSVNSCHVERTDIPRRSNIDNELEMEECFFQTNRKRLLLKYAIVFKANYVPRICGSLEYLVASMARCNVGSNVILSSSFVGDLFFSRQRAVLLNC